MITADMVEPLITSLTGVVTDILPACLGLMAVMLSPRVVKSVIKMFTST